MKVVHLLFDAQFEAEIIGLLHREVKVPGYARVDNVVGARAVERQGRRAYRTDDHNSLLIIMCEEETARRIITAAGALRQRLGHGVRAYVMQAEQSV